MPKKPECGILLPYDVLLSPPGGPSFPCVLPRGHDCFEHMAIMEDGRHLLWNSAHDCGCSDFPECDCFDFSYLNKAEASRFLLKYWNP
jgi:hypothetical protein